jgi:hypothetical protein
MKKDTLELLPVKLPSMVSEKRFFSNWAKQQQ